MFIERTTKAIGDTTRIVVDLSNPIWLDASETITTVVNATVSLGASGWTVQQPPQTPPIVPYDPTPLTLQSTTIVAGAAGASSAVQFFVQSGTPGNVYTVQCVVNGSSTRAITIQATVQISGTPPTPPNTGFNPPAGAVSPYLSLTGGTMTGPLMLSETPVASAEAATKSYVDAETTARTTAVSAETTRATTAETTNATAITTETTRATAAEATLTTNVATNATAIATETTRAETAEAVNHALAADNTGRNFIHNAAFGIAQRGIGPFTTNVYTIDRWLLAFATDSNSVTQTALADADRTAIGDESATWCMANVVTSAGASSSFSQLFQRIEDVRRLAGKTVTVSFWAKALSAGLNLGTYLTQSFGTGGSPSGGVNIAAQAVALTTTMTRHSLTFTVPSAAGKTLGTNGASTSYTQFAFAFSSGSTNAAQLGVGVQSGTFVIYGVQLEIGSAASPFEVQHSVRVVSDCQRFYASMAGLFYGGYSLTGGPLYATAQFPVTMRASPTVVLTATSYVNGSGIAISNAATNSAVGVGFVVTTTGTGVLTYSLTASADL